MRVFTRVDRRGRVAFAETYGGMLGPRAYGQLDLSAQQLYTGEELEKMLEPHARCDGNVDTVYLNFENENIPVCHQSEFRLVARLAAVYHNALVEQNLGADIGDQDGEGDPLERHSAQSDVSSVNDASTIFESVESSVSSDTEWDEAEYGDRCYHDQEFEMNQDLGQPWLEHGEAAEERWGIWG